MATLTVPSVSALGTSVSGSVTLNKPTGLVVGDLLVAVFIATGSTPSSLNTPSGWTLKQTTISAMSSAYFYKIATADDVAASNFTFTTVSAVTTLRGVLMRVSNIRAADFLAAQTSATQTNNVTSFSFSSLGFDPPTSDCLVVGIICSGETVVAGDHTINSVTTTPSASLVNLFDITQSTLAGFAFYTIQTAQTTITAVSGNTTTTSDDRTLELFSIRPNHPTSGSANLLSTNPTFIAPTARADTNATSDIHEAQSIIFPQNGRGDSPTQWANESKPSTDWINEQI